MKDQRLEQAHRALISEAYRLRVLYQNTGDQRYIHLAERKQSQANLIQLEAARTL